MEEIGIDISDHRSKHLDEFLDSKVHTVITVCGYADQDCPIFPGMVKRYHWGFDDPAKATGSEEEVFAVFRRVRDEIGKVFGAYAAGINLGTGAGSLIRSSPRAFLTSVLPRAALSSSPSDVHISTELRLWQRWRKRNRSTSPGKVPSI